MHFEHTEKTKNLMNLISKFIEDNVRPAEEVYTAQMKEFRDSGNPWQVPPVIYELKDKAKS